jgi:hypothetical protein
LAGLVVLALAPGHFYEDTYLGSLFLVGSLAAAVAAFGVFRGHRWGWALGAVSVGAAAMAVCAELQGAFPGL